MAENKQKYYLTTPIYYVNARPHIGHAYTTIVADVVARRRRLLGDDVWFLTGTDEHGQKIERAAKAAGTSPQEFADGVSIQFEDLWKRMGITYDQFIRTTDKDYKRGAAGTPTKADHKSGVEKLFRTLQAAGKIEPRAYTGAYCVSDETFVDAPVGTPCPDCGRVLEEVTEENYFFKLSDYQRDLIDLIEGRKLEIESTARRNEVLSFLRGPVAETLLREGDTKVSTWTNEVFEKRIADTVQEGKLELSSLGEPYVPGALKDLSISRTSFNWGIPVPGDEKHVIYVWLDALTNYISAIGYGDPEREKSFEHYWPADLHLVGKEIIRFHCVYWPAFLLAAELQLPKKIVAHGWLLFEESKMSKSRGNIVRAETILDAFGSLKPEASKAEQDLFGADVLRYFLLKELTFGQDGSFSFDALFDCYNTELANGYGNLVSRTLAMITQYCNGLIPSHGSWKPHKIVVGSKDGIANFVDGIDTPLADPATAVQIICGEAFDALRFSFQLDKARDATGKLVISAEDNRAGVIDSVDFLIAQTDNWITSTTPWKLAKSDLLEARKDLENILYASAEAIRYITALLYPILPHSTAKVWRQLGLGDIEAAAKNGELKNLEWGGLKPGTKLGELGPIFPRADKELINRMNEMEQNNAAAAPVAEAVAPVAAPAVVEEKTSINIDDFMKVELRVAQILVAERIPKADKLLRLEVDLGTEKRQILSGIAEHYTPEELIGRRIIVVANLAPRKMRGLESHGMLLAASVGDGDKPVLASVPEDAVLGARVR